MKLASASSVLAAAIAILCAPAPAGAAPAAPVSDAPTAEPSAKQRGDSNRQRRGKGRRLYLALGDSLAAGIQPGADGSPRTTRQGYAHKLARRLRLRLVNFGCGGATSGSFIAGSRQCAPKPNPRYRNRGRRTSQLAGAVRFLRRHRERVALVTIDIGANDVARCGAEGAIDLECVNDGVARIRGNLPRIARALRRAAGRRVPMTTMTLYDPFLALWRDGGGGQILARLSQDLARDQVNSTISTAFAEHGFEVADVAAAFKTYEPVPTDGAVTDPPPVAVARICRLTWMCAPAPRGPDIHANKRGYTVIANAFRREVARAVKRRR